MVAVILLFFTVALVMADHHKFTDMNKRSVALQTSSASNYGNESVTMSRYVQYAWQSRLINDDTSSTIAPATASPVLISALVLDCRFHGSAVSKVNWLKNGSPLTPSSQESTTQLNTDDETAGVSKDMSPVEHSGMFMVSTRSRLYLDCPSSNDQGLYTCEANSSKGRLSRTQTVFIDDHLRSPESRHCRERGDIIPARITMWRRRLFSVIGSSVVLPCRAEGNPKPSIRWKMNDVTLNLTSLDDRLRIDAEGSLVIEDLQWIDMGLYQCTAINQFHTDSVLTFVYPLKK